MNTPPVHHWPVVERLNSGDWGVWCLACSTKAGDYVYRCSEVDGGDWPPPVLRAVPEAADQAGDGR